MLDQFSVRVTGKKSGLNTHIFDGTFTFECQEDAEAFADFQIESSLLDPELENVAVKKLYDKKKKP